MSVTSRGGIVNTDFFSLQEKTAKKFTFIKLLTDWSEEER